ncbi:MAG: branched-chain amino acid transaminase [candidate division Zixibacteria bacterium]|nr:branched-chain amino acid transaminase [candidate division Zixibacteria bacterium]
MPFHKVDYIWMNGEMVKWDDAKIHVLSHVVHYGSSLFEGQRCYKTPKGPACFRHQDHVDRLWNSCKIYRMEIPFSRQEIFDAALNIVAINNLEECYIRPVVYRGYDSLGVDPSNCPVDVAIAAWPWGKYLGPEAMEKGVKVCVSSWRRNAPDTMPMMAKSGANYMGGQLIKLEAISRGYVEGIALDTFGHVSEGSGENIFIVYKGKLITPPFSASVLPGITRDTIMILAREMGIEVEEQNIPREMLYIADEVFFTGSAAEVSPISHIDDIRIGAGRRGPITEKLQKKLFDIVEGREEDTRGWLTYVPAHESVAAK